MFWLLKDEPNIRELVCLHLGHEGYVCDAVGDGQVALKRAEADRYDLMVIDLMIPGLDGSSLVPRRSQRSAQSRRADSDSHRPPRQSRTR